MQHLRKNCIKNKKEFFEEQEKIWEKTGKTIKMKESFKTK